MSTQASPANRLAGSLRDRLPLSRRSDERELLDGADVDAAELTANLRDLARLNRLAGGRRASITAIAALADDPRHVQIVDIGTGAGDLPLAFWRHGRRSRGRWRVTAVDNRADVLAHAASQLAAAADVTLLLADATKLPLDDRSVDIVHASLLLHHLDPIDAVKALGEMRRIARKGLVINDLRRGPLSFALAAPVVLGLGRSKMTRHDGLISLRRAYTLPELDELLTAAGLEVVSRSNPLMPRVITTAIPRVAQ